MQGNLLFVGCSHTNGFHWNEKSGDKFHWQDNNYAKIYAESLADDICYIYAGSGAPNSKYPRWIRHVLNTHKIDGVLIQSTYWDRWPMGNNLDLKFRHLEPGYFTRKFLESDKFVLYDDYNTRDYNVVEWNEKVKWDSVGMYDEGCPELNGGYDWKGFDTNYMHMKFHTEIVTHLKNEEYCKDIFVIDSMCNVPVYIWRINDRVQMSENLNMFGDLKNVKVFETPANIWIKDNLNIDIEEMKIDEEHYNFDAHKIIAEKFIPEVLNGSY